MHAEEREESKVSSAVGGLHNWDVCGCELTPISQLTGLSLRISVGTVPPMGNMAAGIKPAKSTGECL